MKQKYMPVQQWREGQRKMLEQFEVNLASLKLAASSIDDELKSIEQRRIELVRQRQQVQDEYATTFKAREVIRNDLEEA